MENKIFKQQLIEVLDIEKIKADNSIYINKYQNNRNKFKKFMIYVSKKYITPIIKKILTEMNECILTDIYSLIKREIIFDRYLHKSLLKIYNIVFPHHMEEYTFFSFIDDIIPKIKNEKTKNTINYDNILDNILNSQLSVLITDQCEKKLDKIYL